MSNGNGEVSSFKVWDLIFKVLAFAVVVAGAAMWAGAIDSSVNDMRNDMSEMKELVSEAVKDRYTSEDADIDRQAATALIIKNSMEIGELKERLRQLENR